MMLVKVVGIVIISEVSMITIYIRVWLHPRTIKILIHKNIQKFIQYYTESCELSSCQICVFHTAPKIQKCTIIFI